MNRGTGITAPADLAGRRVGVPEYQLTAVVWQRGILAEHHGVPVEPVRYGPRDEDEGPRPSLHVIRHLDPLR